MSVDPSIFSHLWLTDVSSFRFDAGFANVGAGCIEDTTSPGRRSTIGSTTSPPPMWTVGAYNTVLLQLTFAPRSSCCTGNGKASENNRKCIAELHCCVV